jgi:enoyl-[acyl-carrier-protein] reductase (NADH)
MRGLRGIVLGVANSRSIAYGIAKACRDAGAELALTYQGEALEKRVRPLAAELGAHVLGHCDVTEAATIDAAFAEAAKLWGRIDFVVHCIAERSQLYQVARHLLLLLHRHRAAGGKANDQWRFYADAHLLRRRKMDAAL